LQNFAEFLHGLGRFGPFVKAVAEWPLFARSDGWDGREADTTGTTSPIGTVPSEAGIDSGIADAGMSRSVHILGQS
jgi:hypothetical protein